jgi:hypothetical protein
MLMDQDTDARELMSTIAASPAPRAPARVAAIDAFWDFLQNNFLLLFPISLFVLLGIFAAIIAASP